MSGETGSAVLTKAERRLRRMHRSLYRWLWLRRKGPAVRSQGVFIFGAQRSGTTMLAESLENSPEFDVFGETSIAFKNSLLKGLDTARELIHQSKRPFVAFKPLTDSHRVTELLSVAERSKGVWMYRSPDDRANSAVASHGDANLRFLRELIAAGPTDRWEARGLTPGTSAVIRRLDPDALDAHSAAGAFWFLRNQLYFDQQLDRNPDVLLLRYEMLVANPRPTMEAVCDFIGCEFDPRMIRHIHGWSVGRRNDRLSPEVSELCGKMLKMLDMTLVHQWRSKGFPHETP